MAITKRKIVTFLLCFIGAVYCDSRDFESVDSSEFSTPPTYFQYKVKALNTALYYILRALQEDLEAKVAVDASFINRISIIIMKINFFYGEVDETNALTLGEILRKLPGYVRAEMDLAGLNFNEYTETPASGTELTTDTYLRKSA